MDKARQVNIYISPKVDLPALLSLSERQRVITAERVTACGDQVPAGLVDAGENAEQAAARELKEETGYIGKVTYPST